MKDFGIYWHCHGKTLETHEQRWDIISLLEVLLLPLPFAFPLPPFLLFCLFYKEYTGRGKQLRNQLGSHCNISSERWWWMDDQWWRWEGREGSRFARCYGDRADRICGWMGCQLWKKVRNSSWMWESLHPGNCGTVALNKSVSVMTIKVNTCRQILRTRVPRDISCQRKNCTGQLNRQGWLYSRLLQ